MATDYPTAFKIVPAKNSKGTDCYAVKLFWSMPFGETQRGGLWSSGANCDVRKFTSVDGARRNVLTSLGHIQER